MSNFLRWNLFIATLIGASVVVYAIWNGIDANLFKFVVSFLVVTGSVALIYLIGRAGSEGPSGN